MQKDIQNWLDGTRNYAEGVEILKNCGGSPFLINLLSAGPDAYNTPKLLAELTALHLKVKPGTLPEPQPEQGTSPEPETEEPAAPYIPDHDLEKKLRIKKMITEIWKEMCHCHGQLSILPEGRQLFEVSKMLLTKELKKNDLWDQLHYFENTGKWFDELPENQPKPFDREQKIKNLMASRSKCTARLKKPLPESKRQHEQKKIADFDKRINDLRSLRP